MTQDYLTGTNLQQDATRGPRLPDRAASTQHVQQRPNLAGAASYGVDEFVRITGVGRPLSGDRPVLDIAVRTAAGVGSTLLLRELLMGGLLLNPYISVPSVALTLFAAYVVVEPCIGRPDHAITPRRMMCGVAVTAVGLSAAMAAAPMAISATLLVLSLAGGVNVLAHNIVE